MPGYAGSAEGPEASAEEKRRENCFSAEAVPAGQSGTCAGHPGVHRLSGGADDRAGAAQLYAASVPGTAGGSAGYHAVAGG